MSAAMPPPWGFCHNYAHAREAQPTLIGRLSTGFATDPQIWLTRTF